MHDHEGTDPSVSALEAGLKNGSVRTLEALNASPATQSTAATATEGYLGASSQRPAPNRASGLPMTQSLETAAPHSAFVQAKPRNVYLVPAFCSLGCFLFGADTGKCGE